jgi:hypothetical protein
MSAILFCFGSEAEHGEMIERDWYGCHGNGWNGILAPDAFAHPAKVAFGLADRIYSHCMEMGYLRPGNVVLDPFFGVGGFAYHALLSGLDVVGVELEEKFVTLAQANLDRWQANYGPGNAVLDDLRDRGLLPPYGSATLLQGDSRFLCDVLSEAGGVVSSPPYAESMGNDGSGIDWSKQADRSTSHPHGYDGDGYGITPGQLGSMRVVSSPPYADGCQHTGGDDSNPEHIQGGKLYGVGIAGAVSSPPYSESLASDDPDKRGGLYRDPKRRNDKTLTAEYGESAGQLGAMRVVSSPPWENQEPVQDNEFFRLHRLEIGRNPDANGGTPGHYGFSLGQLGTETTDDFWTAARQIMHQVAALLPPDAVTVWVCKRFVRDKEIVEFSKQWAALGESCGFETIEWIRAWLIEDRGQQYDLFGELHHKQVKRASFFRNLYEKKYPENAIDWEDVIIQRRLPVEGLT